jgi:hypothetical protein
VGAVILTIAIWAAHFALVYGFTALACARSFAGLVPWLVVPVSIAAVAGIGVLAMRGPIRAARSLSFSDTVACGLGVLAIIAVVWEASSMLLPSCA